MGLIPVLRDETLFVAKGRGKCQNAAAQQKFVIRSCTGICTSRCDVRHMGRWGVVSCVSMNIPGFLVDIQM